jgi:hypothetical protein
LVALESGKPKDKPALFSPSREILKERVERYRNNLVEAQAELARLIGVFANVITAARASCSRTARLASLYTATRLLVCWRRGNETVTRATGSSIWRLGTGTATMTWTASDAVPSTFRKASERDDILDQVADDDTAPPDLLAGKRRAQDGRVIISDRWLYPAGAEAGPARPGGEL